MPQIRTALHFLRRGLAASLRHDIRLDAPAPVAPDPADLPLIERIQTSYRLMKSVDSPPWCAPSPEWQTQLDQAYAALRDRVKFAYFLANFGQWPQYTGIEEIGYQIQRMRHMWIGRRYLEDVFFRSTLRAWGSFGRSLSGLAFPRFGNQAGAWYRGTYVSAGAPFNDLLGQQIRQLVHGPRPVLGELGAGYGKLAYCALRDLPGACYLDFDLPETLCTAAFYLAKCFPKRRLLLYGEQPLTAEVLQNFDLIFMPSWEITQLPDLSVDCFFNKNSLGEMRPESVRTYIAQIARITRSYVFHLNHDRERCGDGLLATEYPLPEPFRLILRIPDLGHLLVQSQSSPDIFQYLWQRSCSCAVGPEPIVRACGEE